MKHVNRVATAIVPGIALALFGATAGAVDLRDWGKKYATIERFVVLSQFNDDAVLDKETQLVWQRRPAAEMVSVRYQAAIACANVTTGGRRGWRLPSLHEMATLADPAVPVNSLALPTGHPFTSVPKGLYWTATIVDGLSTHGWRVNLNYSGLAVYNEKGTDGYYWCVRGDAAFSVY